MPARRKLPPPPVRFTDPINPHAFDSYNGVKRYTVWTPGKLRHLLPVLHDTPVLVTIQGSGTIIGATLTALSHAGRVTVGTLNHLGQHKTTTVSAEQITGPIVPIPRRPFDSATRVRKRAVQTYRDEVRQALDLAEFFVGTGERWSGRWLGWCEQDGVRLELVNRGGPDDVIWAGWVVDGRLTHDPKHPLPSE